MRGRCEGGGEAEAVGVDGDVGSGEGDEGGEGVHGELEGVAGDAVCAADGDDGCLGEERGG